MKLLHPMRQLALGASLGTAALTAAAQVRSPAPADSLHKFENPAGVSAPGKRPFFHSKVFRATIVPAALIGYGATTIYGNGLYSSYNVKNDVRHLFGSYRNHADDYLQFVPYAAIPAVLLAGVDSRNDRLNLGLVIVKSELLMLSSVYLVKTLASVQRPDSSDRLSFPSGHTAQAFLAASIFHAEFRDKSPWYGVGAYAVASTVGAFRIINNKHWQSDVLAGAGFGILSAHLAYLSHRNRWGRKPGTRGIGELGHAPAPKPQWQLSPTLLPGGLGVSAVWRSW